MFRLRYLLPLVLVISLLAVPASSSANAPSATVSFAGNAKLIPDSGGFIMVTLHYSCAPGIGLLTVIMNEPGIASQTSANNPAVCDSKQHSVTLTIGNGFTPSKSPMVLPRSITVLAALHPLRPTSRSSSR